MSSPRNVAILLAVVALDNWKSLVILAALAAMASIPLWWPR